MPSLSRPLAHTIATRHGAVTKLQLLSDGLSEHSIRRLIGNGTLITLHQHVYRLGTSPDTFELRCAAACLADPHLVVTGIAAGRLWKFRHIPTTELPIVLVEHFRTSLSAGVIVRRTNRLSNEDIVRRPDAIEVASPPRAWFDCSRDLDDEHFERLTEWMLDKHSRAPTLWRTLRRLNQQGRPGLARAKKVLSQRPNWQKPAGSGLELQVLRALEHAGVPQLTRQHTIRLNNGSVVHPDGALPEVRWAVEVDHVTWHGGRFDAQYDKARDRQLRRIRWCVERVTDAELRDDFHGTIGELAEMYQLRIAMLAA
jgi:very-short-patch-repair endonuclease